MNAVDTGALVDCRSSPIESIPKDWDKKTLLDAVGMKKDLIVAGPFGSNLKVSDYRDEGIPIIRLQNIDYGKFIDKEIKYVSTEKAKELVYHSFHAGDLVLAKLGDPIGKTCIVPDYFQDGIVVSDVVRIRVEGGWADKKFIMYSLNSVATKNQLINGTIGSTRPRVNLDQIRDLRIFVPPLNEQCKIATILSSVDAAIESTEAIIDRFKDIKAGLLHDLLIHGIDEKGMLREPAVRPEQFKDSPIGMIPINWTVRPIGSACTLIKDGTHLPPKRVEEGPLLLSVRNMINGQLQLTNSDTRVSWEFYKSMHRNWEIQLGDVLLAIVGATIGKTAIVPLMPPFTIQRSVAVLRGRGEVLNNNFLNFWLSGPYFQAHLWRKVNQTAQPGIYLEELSSFYIPLPSLNEQKVIASILNANSSQIQVEESYLNRLKQLKHGLMQDLLTGKVRVKVE